ncbi:class I SAM-dependent methyltransferase [Kordiimonas sp.]|uniref:class I SAM-dependent methyltransferase n=1 Tax=Kordiimonas sp. TaxID=1970157 RepID=UPI003A8E3CA3
MRPDVLRLHRFYASPLGQTVGALVSDRLRGLLARRPGGVTVGLGYALPYLDAIEHREADTEGRYLAFMPAQQGVCHWPSALESRTALVEDYHLPMPDSSVDRFILAHALEHANRPKHMLREIWRVLAPGGQIVLIVPNRRRSWSALDVTPFGHGRPYSKAQLYELMSEQMLPPEGWDTALMLPPFTWPGGARIVRYGERVVHALGRNLGGVLLVCAQKQVYGALPKASKAVRGMPVLTGPGAGA